MDIDEDDGKWIPSSNGLRHSLYRCLSLFPGMDIESRLLLLALFFAQQYFFEIAQCRRGGLGLEVLAEATNILTNQMRVVVDDQHTVYKRLACLGHTLSTKSLPGTVS